MADELDAYLARIDHRGPRTPTIETLRSLHRAHAFAVPFENVDIQLGRPIRLDLESLQRKIVHHRRGGYCFEQNALFAWALRSLGFPVTTLAARVRWGATAPTPRSHMLLDVRIDGASYLADVGFGRGLVEPLAMIASEPQRQGDETYRLLAIEAKLLLQTFERDAWNDLYLFDREECFPIDYEVANHYTSTHPDSRFVQGLIVARPTERGRASLRNRTLSLPGEEPREIDVNEIVGALSRFGLEIAADSRFRCFSTATRS